MVTTTKRPEGSKHSVEAQPPRKLKFVQMSTVEPEEIEWLWHPYIPKGTLTLLYGPGGMGKSWIAAAIAADLSAGRALPGMTEAPVPQKILMVSAEDSPGKVLSPRLRVLNADMKNIFFSQDIFTLDTAGIVMLENGLKELDAAILFLDPLVSYLGGKMDINKANESRAMMGPLMEVARRTNAAIVVVHHTRKGTLGRDNDRAMGSADFTNTPRSALLVDQTEAGAHFMRHSKSNWSMPGTALAYNVVDNIFSWGGAMTAIEAKGVSVTPLKHNQAVDFIKNLLANGKVSVEEVIAQAKIMGLPERTLERAKKGLAHSVRDASKWYWELEAGVLEGLEVKVTKKDPVADILLRARALARGKANG